MAAPSDGARGPDVTGKSRGRGAAVGWTVLAGLVLAQAWVFWFKLPLSLGPRVILEPWLLRHGFTLYETAMDIHTPLMPLLIAALSPLVPDGLALAMLLLVALVSLTALLTFVAAKRHAGPVAALWALFCFAAWSPVFEFRKLWHETFLTPLYVLLFLAYRPDGRERGPGKLIALGVLGGVAVMFKQHAAAVLLAIILWNAFTGWTAKRPKASLVREAAVVMGAAALPVLAFAAYQLAAVGTLRSFLNWTVLYELSGVYQASASKAPTFRQIGVVAAFLVLLPPVLACAWRGRRRGDPMWRVVAAGLVLAGASALAAYPRFELFHLQPVLPLLAVLSSVALADLVRRGGAVRTWTLAAGAGVGALWVVTGVVVVRPAIERPGPRPIREYSPLLPVAEEIAGRIGPKDTIYVFPDEEPVSNLYYLLRREPPHFWTFHYPWLMVEPVRARIVRMLEEEPPRWIVYRPGQGSIESSAPEIVAYIKAHYREVARLASAADETLLLERITAR